MTAELNVPGGYRAERLGRVAFAVPDAFELRATLRTGHCELRDELWPLPAGTGRRAAREADRQEVWRRWFADLVVESAGVAPEEADPVTFDPSGLSPRRRRALPIMGEERQLGTPDPDAPLGAPPPGARWLRAAAYQKDGYGGDLHSGRALLDAGAVRLWLLTGATTPLYERMFDWVEALAASYRPGPPSEAPPGRFVLHHGHVAGFDTPARYFAESVRAHAKPDAATVAAVVQGAPPPSPLDHISVGTKVLDEDPEPYDYTFDQGLAATNASGRALGVSFEKVREGTVRSADGVEGYESVSLARQRGDAPKLVARWHARGARADPGRPEIEVEAEATLGDRWAARAGSPLAEPPLGAAVEAALAAWGVAVAAVRIP